MVELLLELLYLPALILHGKRGFSVMLKTSVVLKTSVAFAVDTSVTSSSSSLLVVVFDLTVDCFVVLVGVVGFLVVVTDMVVVARTMFCKCIIILIRTPLSLTFNAIPIFTTVYFILLNQRSSAEQSKK